MFSNLTCKFKWMWKVGDTYVNGQKITAVGPYTASPGGGQTLSLGSGTSVIRAVSKPAGSAAGVPSAASGRAAASAATLVPSAPGGGGGGASASTVGAYSQALQAFKTDVGRQLKEASHGLGGLLPNTKRFCYYVARPDEVKDCKLGDMPVSPTDSISCRLAHKPSSLSALTLYNNNLLMQIPGQTLFVAKVATTIGSIPAGTLLALNMGSPDLMWTIGEAGISAIPAAGVTNTYRLVPRWHFGCMLSIPATRPMAPQPIQYSSSASVAIVWPVTDGTNYGFLTMGSPTQFVCTIIGDVTLSTGTLFSGTTKLFNVNSFSQAGNNMIVTPFYPSTGNVVRDVLTITGPAIDNPGDGDFFPNYTICSNMRLTSLAGALANKFGVESYAVGAGAEGPFATQTNFTPANTFASVSQSWSAISTRSRQHGLGELDPSNSLWYAINMASRMACKTTFAADTINDWSCVAGRPMPDTNNPVAVFPIQDLNAFGYPFNSQLMGWAHEATVSFTIISNGGTDGTTYPFEQETDAWMEALVNEDSGFAVLPPMYDPLVTRFGAIINSYPLLARADSFKDYMKDLFGKVKTGAKRVGKTVWRVAKPVLRDMAIEAAMMAL